MIQVAAVKSETYAPFIPAKQGINGAYYAG